MVSVKAESTARLRARQIQRFHHEHIKNGPLPNADRITVEDLRLANVLEPEHMLKKTEDEEDYVKDWKSNARSVTSMLAMFRKTSRALELISQGKEPGDAEDEDGRESESGGKSPLDGLGEKTKTPEVWPSESDATRPRVHRDANPAPSFTSPYPEPLRLRSSPVPRPSPTTSAEVIASYLEEEDRSQRDAERKGPSTTLAYNMSTIDRAGFPRASEVYDAYGEADADASEQKQTSYGFPTSTVRAESYGNATQDIPRIREDLKVGFELPRDQQAGFANFSEGGHVSTRVPRTAMRTRNVLQGTFPETPYRQARSQYAIDEQTGSQHGERTAAPEVPRQRQSTQNRASEKLRQHTYSERPDLTASADSNRPFQQSQYGQGSRASGRGPRDGRTDVDPILTGENLRLFWQLKKDNKEKK